MQCYTILYITPHSLHMFTRSNQRPLRVVTSLNHLTEHPTPPPPWISLCRSHTWTKPFNQRGFLDRKKTLAPRIAPTHCDQGCGRTLKNSELGGVRNLSVPSFLLFEGAQNEDAPNSRLRPSLLKLKHSLQVIYNHQKLASSALEQSTAACLQ